MKKLLALLAITIATDANASSQIIRCERPRSEPIAITLDADHQYGASLNCVSSGFIFDMTPCAPTNGWGMSAPTGIGALVGVARRWQEYADHVGGLTYSAIDGTRMLFTGGYHGLDGKTEEYWSIDIDRVTGKGMVKLNKAEMPDSFMPQAGIYSCRAVARKF